MVCGKTWNGHGEESQKGVVKRSSQMLVLIFLFWVHLLYTVDVFLEKVCLVSVNSVAFGYSR